MSQEKETWQENYKLILFRQEQQDKAIAELRSELSVVSKKIDAIHTEIVSFKRSAKVAVAVSGLFGSILTFFFEHFWKRS
jgi:hypothetical protein